MTARQPLRRRAVLAGGMGALALLVAAPQTSTATSVEPYSLAAWQPLLGTTLAVEGGAVLRLDRVIDLRKDPLPGEVDDGAERFRLEFKLLEGSLKSELLNVVHPQLGSLPLFTSHHAPGASAIIDRRGAAAAPPAN